MPRLDDDGRAVTLDLHGARVHEAVRLAEAAVEEAARRGRSSVRLVHGTSTADRGAERTIKGALALALDDGAFPDAVSSFQTDGALLLGLPPDPSPDPARITLAGLR
jgi:DNA-nicking Smr family endonuclease